MKPARRHLALTAMSLAAAAPLILAAGPAFAADDKATVTKQVEAFRAAQVAADGAALTALSAPELSYSHSNGRVEDRATFVENATSPKTKFTFVEYRDPSIRIVGDVAIVRFNWVAEQETIPEGKKTATNLHVLMIWQKQGNDWKLLARSATKL